MNRQAAFLTLLIVFFLLVLGRPLAAQDVQPADTPPVGPAPVFVDPAPGQDWRPFEIAGGETAPIAAEAPLIHPQASPGMTDYVQSDLLLLIYTNTASGQLGDAYVEMAKEQALITRDFIWRNSHFKYFINLTFLVIDEYVDETEYESPFGCGWLWADDYDGDGESPEVDMVASGITEGQFDSINLFFPRGDNSIPLCGYGGLTWPGGWDWQQLGHTMITANLLIPTGETLWNPFNHEFQHSIDGAYSLKGIEEYFNPDLPWAEPYRFGDNWNFHSVLMRNWPVMQWLELVGEWGDYHQVPDADEDGLPDIGDLPLTELSLGSSPASKDSEGDGFDDLQEAMAGMFRASDPLAANSDGDAWNDAEDFEPLYPISDHIEEKAQILDGDPAGWTLLTDHLESGPEGFTAAVYANWYEGALRVMFKLNQHANIFMHLDGQADGFWHGRDNYAFHLYPEGDPLRSAAVQDCSEQQTDLEKFCRFDDDSGYAFDRLVDPSDFGRFTTYDGDYYIVQLAIPADADTGFSAEVGGEIGLNFWFEDIDGHWGRSAWTFARDDVVYLPLLNADSAKMTGTIIDLGRCGDENQPLAAKVEFVGGGNIYDTYSGEDGRYELWLLESGSPYRMTLYKYSYHTTGFDNIVVEAGKINRFDAGVQPDEPCLTVDPLHPSLALPPGGRGEQTLVIMNAGAARSWYMLENIRYSGEFDSWLSVDPSEGWVDAGSQEAVVLSFDAGAAGAAPGMYTANLDLKSHDPVNPLIPIAVTLEVVDYGLAITPQESEGESWAGTSVSRRFTIKNTGTTTDTVDLAVSSPWPAELSSSSLMLDQNEEADIWLAVDIPSGAAVGETETAVLTATSQSAPDIDAQAAFTLTVIDEPLIYLPMVKRP